jgi:hypothetical protein
MGKCILSFDQIEIVEEKSDGRYSDNDWMIITWFVGDKVIRTDKFPLLSLNGGVGLKSGDGITPFTSEVDCLDDDIVAAAYNVVNLGSTDFSDQADAAAKIAQSVSEALTQAYLKAAEVYLEYFSEIPFSELLADQLDDFAPIIVSSVGAAYTDVIVPLLNDLIQEIQILIGRPNCNGDVFHDVAVFKPGQPVPDSTSGTKYTAASVTGCHGAAVTNVFTTLHRTLDVPQQFAPTTQLPTVYFVPSKSKTDWLSLAAEDGTTNSPMVVVTIGPSRAASGLYAVTVTEKVDARFDAVFTASADPVSVETIRVTPFVGNIHATVRPWSSRSIQPGDLMATLAVAKASSSATKNKAAKKSVASKSAAFKTAQKAQATLQSPASQYTFTLGWQKVETVGFSPTRPVGFLGGGLGGVSPTSAVPDILEHVNVLQIPAQGVTICLYELQLSGGDRIAYALRYTRAQNLSFTTADWELVTWSPV